LCANLFSCDTHRLTGKSAADQVYRGQILAAHGGDILITRHMRPVLGKHATAVGVGFDLPHDLMPRPFQAEVQSPDATEQGTDRHDREGE
jgi:hypothetical protein|tara:strand:- start:196 stop:465 length:270 start_codon:yes stop_codon:yes gene_type:complete